MDELTLFPDLSRFGYAAHLVRVDPTYRDLADPITGEPVWDSLWLIESWFTETVIPMDTVLEALASDPDVKPEHRTLIAEVHVASVLHHPKSPYGLGWQREGGDGEMLLFYRGFPFTRTPDGVLEREPGGRMEGWPTPNQWRRAKCWTRLIGRKRGLQWRWTPEAEL